MHMFKGGKERNMRRSDKQIKDQTEIDSIIRGSAICHLALSDGDQPYVVPLNFGYENGTLFFHCAHEGQKVDIIRRNPRVCFSLVESHRMVTSETSCSWTTRYRSVTGFGTALIMEDRQSKAKALEVIMRQYSGGENQFEDKAVDKVLIIRIDIESMTGKASGD